VCGSAPIISLQANNNIMADRLLDNDGGGEEEIFVYTGGRVPQHLRQIITHVIIDGSATIVIEDEAFQDCQNLLSVEQRGGRGLVERVGRQAFECCFSLKSVKLPGVKIIEDGAFSECEQLEDVDFGDVLETIGEVALQECLSLQRIKLPGVKTIGRGAFKKCTALNGVEFGDKLETIGGSAFFRCDSISEINLPSVKRIGVLAFAYSGVAKVKCSDKLVRIGNKAFKKCTRLRRIVMPLRDGIYDGQQQQGQRYMHTIGINAFDGCNNLSTVDLIIGGIHETVPYLHMEVWRDEINREINRINQVLPTIAADSKTEEIKSWGRLLITRILQYKTEHFFVVKEAMVLLELALWKTKLLEKFEEIIMIAEQERVSVTTRRQRKRARLENRQDLRITSGAEIIIENVLPFLTLPDQQMYCAEFPGKPFQCLFFLVLYSIL
jgi:hypothetical protein